MNLQKLLISLCLLTLTFGCDIGGGQFTASKPVGGQIEVSADPGTQAFLARSGFLGSASINDRAIGASRYLVYHSSQDLLPNDSNGQSDIYLRDTLTGTSSLISLSTANVQGDGASTQASISADGRYVVFRSAATNLVTGDTNGVEDIFMRDTVAGTTVRVSLGSGTTQATGTSLTPAVSNGGRYVVFASEADNLVTGDNNAQPDIFVRDTQSNTTTLISSTSIGLGSANGASFDPAITPDGAFIAFSSEATNVIAGGLSGRQILRVERATPTNRVLVSQNGAQANGPCYEPSMSSDGNIIAFFSNATNLGTDANAFFDVYIRDITAGTTTRASVASTGETDNHSGFPSISGDGSIVAFGSIATNLVAGDGNGVFDVFTRTGTTTTRVSVNSAGGQANIDSDLPAISLDGTRVAFRSAATDLVPQDNVADDDIFMHHLASATTVLQSLACKFPAIDPAKGVDKDYPVGTRPVTVLSGDLDGDGDLDLLAVNFSGPLISVLKNDGLGNYAPAVTGGGLAARTRDAQLGDIDGDNDLDLVTYQVESEALKLYLNDGNGNFSFSTGIAALDGTSENRIRLGDIDKDGDLDIAWSHNHFLDNSGIAVMRNTRSAVGQISFDAPTYLFIGQNMTGGLSFGDINGDTHLDLVFQGRNDNEPTSGLRTALNDGTGSFSLGASIPDSAAHQFVAVGDVNGDNHQDLVATTNRDLVGNPESRLSLFLNDGSGGFPTRTPLSDTFYYNSRQTPRDVQVIDLNGDGHLDIVGIVEGGGSELFFHMNRGDGTFGFSQGAYSGFLATGLALGDFDGDQDIDAATAQSGLNTVRVHLEQINPHFPRLTEQDLPQTLITGQRGLTVGDFDGDGNLDLYATVETDPTTVNVYKNSPAGTFTYLTQVVLSHRAGTSELADLDGDGSPEVIAYSRFSSTEVSVLKSSSGTLSVDSTLDIGFVPDRIRARDLNQDSFPDLIASRVGGSFRVYLNDGDGNFTPPPANYPGGLISVGDVDQDGDLDVAAAGAGILLNDGSGSLTPFGPSLPSASEIVLADIDNDGKLDLVYSIGTSRTLNLRKNTGNVTFSSPVTLETSIRPSEDTYDLEIFVLDIDGDGDNDIISSHGESFGAGSIAINLNKGNGEFASSVDYLPNRTISSTITGDFDGDGDIDLVSYGEAVGFPAKGTLLLNQICP